MIEVFKICDVINPAEIRTAINEPLAGLPEDMPESECIFIDLNPDANWAHECCYIFIELGTREVRVCKAEWPPSERHELLPLEPNFNYDPKFACPKSDKGAT